MPKQKAELDNRQLFQEFLQSVEDYPETGENLLILDAELEIPIEAQTMKAASSFLEKNVLIGL